MVDIIERCVWRPLRALACPAVAWAIPALASAQSASIAPTVTLAFSPASISSGTASTLTITFGNANAGPATLQQSMNDVLPSGLTVAAGAVGGSCGAGSVSAQAGSGIVTYLSGAVIPPGGCAFTVGVTASSATESTYYTDTIGAGALVTDLGSNASAASATLTVQAGGTVPSVVGLSQSAASAQLTAAGFAIAVATAVSNTIAPGVVIGTQPAAGSAQPRGSTVRMLVSAGPGSAANAPISSAPGLTPEEQAVARGLEQTCSALAGAYTAGTALNTRQQDLLNKCSAIIADYSGGTGASELKHALDAISGRQATAEARAPMQFAAGQIANIGGRLSALRAGAQGISISGLDLGMPGASQSALGALLDFGRDLLGKDAFGGAAGEDSGDLLGKRLGLFATGTLRRGDQTTSDAEQGFDFKNTGLTVGADYRLGTSYVLGIAGGYGKSSTIFDDAGGRVDSRHVAFSLYGTWFTDNFHIDWLAGFGHHSDDLDRQVNYDSSSVSVGCNGVNCSTQALGSTSARELTFSTSGGLDFHHQAFAFGPTLELEYKQVRVNDFSETGDSGLTLNFGGMTSMSLLAKAGGYVTYAWKTRWAVILPQVRVRYLHEFMNDARTQAVAFAADTLPGAESRSFFVFTDVPDRSYFDWKASVLFQFPFGIAGFVDYGGVTGLRNISSHEVNVGLRVETGFR